MPDFTYEVFFHCITAEHWTKEVQGKSGIYIVTFGPSRGQYEYDYFCTCPGFKFSKKRSCKHIEEAKKDHCKWMQLTDGGKPNKTKEGFRCPKCGMEANALNYAV